MQTRKMAIAIMLCVMALALAVNLAHAQAGPGATVTIRDSSGTQQIQFELGETVFLEWKASRRVDIIVKYYENEDDSTGEVAFEWLNQSAVGTLNFVPLWVGLYEVECSAPFWRVRASAWFFVIPESILGTLMATAVGFAGFGVFRFSRSKRFKR